MEDKVKERRELLASASKLDQTASLLASTRANPQLVGINTTAPRGMLRLSLLAGERDLFRKQKEGFSLSRLLWSAFL